MSDAFDNASYEIEKELYNPDTCCENAVEWIRNSKTATVCFSQRRFITKIKKLAEKHPDKVEIVHENPDGSIVAHIPVSAVHINIHMRKELTPEQRERAIEHMKKVREKRFGNRELTTEELAEIEDEVDNGDDDESEGD